MTHEFEAVRIRWKANELLAADHKLFEDDIWYALQPLCRKYKNCKDCPIADAGAGCHTPRSMVDPIIEALENGDDEAAYIFTRRMGNALALLDRWLRRSRPSLYGILRVESKFWAKMACLAEHDLLDAIDYSELERPLCRAMTLETEDDETIVCELCPFGQRYGSCLEYPHPYWRIAAARSRPKERAEACFNMKKLVDTILKEAPCIDSPSSSQTEQSN